MHPLEGRKLASISSWKEWKQLWEQATHKETLLGLLHVGLHIPSWVRDEIIDRLLFYLDIADGHNDGQPFEVVSQKAFVMLCKEVFSDDQRKEHAVPGVTYEPRWSRLIFHPGVLEKFLRFLRLNVGQRRLYNQTGSYSGLAKVHRETFAQFALEVAQFIWRAPVSDYEPAFRKMLDGAKPEAVSILHALGKLDLLLHKDYRDGIDANCMKRIKQLAMNGQISDGTWRQVRSVREACLGTDSQAAKVLILLDVIQKEQKRLDEIAEAEKLARDVAERLRQLGK